MDGAIIELEKMLAKYGKNKAKRFPILNFLASAQTQTGRLNYLYKAIKNHEASLRFVKSKYSKFHDPRYLLDIANIENQIGYTHRLLEDDEPNAYINAIECYQKGREAALEFKEFLEKRLKRKGNPESKQIIVREMNLAQRTIASISNGLGYVQGLLGFYDDAYFQIESAISIWKQTGDSREIARALTSKAILKRDQGKFEESAILFSDALELPHAKDDRLNLCRIFHHKGWNEWELAARVGFETEEGLRFLEQAYSSLDSSLRSIGVDSKYVREISGIYHNISEMMWRLGQVYKKRGRQNLGREMMIKAREYNKKAIELSKDSRNQRYLIDSLVGEAQYDLEELNLDGINSRFREVIALEKKYPQFGLFYGRMYRIKGDALYLERKFSRAFEMYAKAFPLLSSVRQSEDLELLNQRMEKLAPAVAIRFYNYLLKVWSKDKGNQHLVTWVDSKIYELRMGK